MRNRLRVIVAVGLVSGCGLWVRPALAWNSPGHMIIALVAFDEMDAATRAKAIALLHAHPRFREHFEREMPRDLSRDGDDKDRWCFAHAATWPDQVRDSKGGVTRADSDRLVSDFIAEFDGLTGSQKRTKVLDETDLRRIKLSELVVGDRLDSDRIAKLLAAMQRHTRPVSPRRLGIIGKEHLRTRLLAMAVVPESFEYSRELSKEGVPWVLESAFGWRGADSQDNRRIFAGANWSAAITNPFRSFGATGEGLEAALSDMKAGAHEPIVFVLHLAHPRVEYTDRGKSALVVGGAA